MESGTATRRDRCRTTSAISSSTASGCRYPRHDGAAQGSPRQHQMSGLPAEERDRQRRRRRRAQHRARYRHRPPRHIDRNGRDGRAPSSSTRSRTAPSSGRASPPHEQGIDHQPAPSSKLEDNGATCPVQRPAMIAASPRNASRLPSSPTRTRPVRQAAVRHDVHPPLLPGPQRMVTGQVRQRAAISQATAAPAASIRIHPACRSRWSEHRRDTSRQPSERTAAEGHGMAILPNKLFSPDEQVQTGKSRAGPMIRPNRSLRRRAPPRNAIFGLGRWGDGWDSNPRPLGPQPRALPTELPPPPLGPCLCQIAGSPSRAENADLSAGQSHSASIRLSARRPPLLPLFDHNDY